MSRRRPVEPGAGLCRRGPALVCADAALRRPAPARPCAGLRQRGPAPICTGGARRCAAQHCMLTAARRRPVHRWPAEPAAPGSAHRFDIVRHRPRAVVRNSTRSYLRRDLRYDRAFPGTTARSQVRPRVPGYDHAPPRTTAQARPGHAHRSTPSTNRLLAPRTSEPPRHARHPGARSRALLRRGPPTVLRHPGAHAAQAHTLPDARTAQAGRRTQTTASERRPASPSGPTTSRHRSRPASTRHPSVAPARPARSSAGV